MMLLHQQVILFLLSFLILPSFGIRCTTRCSYAFNRTTSFNIPDNCNEYETVNKCIIILRYTYETDEYNVQFLGIPSISNSILENFHDVKLILSSLMSFEYRIHRECDDKDDCDRILARSVATQMQQQQQYTLNGIQNELKPFILGPSLSSENPNLTCYDSNQNIQSCGTLTQSGSCVISNNIFENKIINVCGDKDIFSTPFVNIYQSNHYLTFDIQCNQSLCNNQTTLQEVKSIIHKYHITMTPDGRLYNLSSKLISSAVVTIFMIIVLFFSE